MSGPLVSAAQMAGLRAFAYRGLQTPVTICPRVSATDGFGGDPKPTWSPGITVLGWVRQMNDSHLQDELGLAGATGIFRVVVPVDTVVHVDDQLLIAGQRYTVNNTNDENTIRVFQEIYARRIE